MTHCRRVEVKADWYYSAFRARVRRVGEPYYPYNKAVRMILKPLDLRSPVVHVIVPTIVFAARHLYPTHGVRVMSSVREFR